MSSPITSVPDPSESSALASIITQVQPGQVPVVQRGARPAKVVTKKAATSPSDPNKKKKKKKSRSAAASSANAGASPQAQSAEADAAEQLRQQDEAVAEAARLGSEAAHSQSRAASSSSGTVAAVGTAQDLSASNSGLTAETEANEGEHSHQPSSTLVGTSTAGNTLTHAEAAPLIAAPAIGNNANNGSLQGSGNPADVVASESSEGTVEKDGLIDVPPRTHAASAAPATVPAADSNQLLPSSKPAASAPSSSATSAAKATPKADQATMKAASKKKQPSFGQRLIAILTCSSASSTMVREEMSEKQQRNPVVVKPVSAPSPAARKPASTAPANNVVVPPRTPNSKGGSRASGDYQTTPGGGTKLPREETGDVMSGAVVPPGSSFVTADDVRKSHASSSSFTDSDEETDEDEDEDDDEDEEGDVDMDEEEYLSDDQTEEQRLIAQGGIGIPVDEFGNPQPLLPAIGSQDTGRKCLVLDLDETLVHSSFKMIQNADFIVPVEIDGTVHNVYVIKRPGVDEFMRQMGEIYEVVVFTASLSKYADPVLDMLDIHEAVRHRLFRESCYNHKGNYVKDLSQLGREIADTIIIDNSPASYIFHPNNAVPISSWFNDPHDTELTDLCPFLADLADVDDVRAVLDGAL